MNTLVTTLETARIIVQTGGVNGDGFGHGDINVNTSLNLTGLHDLTLAAYGNINSTPSASSGTGKLYLRADQGASGTGSVNFNGGNINFAGSSGNVNIFYNSTSYSSPTNFSNKVLMGNATLAAAMLVNNVTNLQNINSNPNGNYALGTDSDASVTSSWNNGAGFIPINNFAGSLTGTNLTGRNYSIPSLSIKRPTSSHLRVLLLIFFAVPQPRVKSKILILKISLVKI